ncbi:hypothetical protein A3K42_00625 [candidate division WWE3 bacterium RBG_13_37_7]|uniref:Uncharacterized protein n=1 Tax=candidate division WWE3 bacterium RBG_13_37_7 TaxID=1802609 RepID=A0A1F4U261_UNCKA|nr:MAG: hypothetical protein A3K42_00625 [candidate division WWE3 bacterium RBG_13_37_7]
MLEKKLITDSLQKTQCPKCGASLDGANLVTVSEAATLFVAHAVCAVCKAESVVTITPGGSGSISVQTDLLSYEFKKFIAAKAITYDDVLNLHVALKKENIWSLLAKKDKNLEKQQKA